MTGHIIWTNGGNYIVWETVNGYDGIDFAGTSEKEEKQLFVDFATETNSFKMWESKPELSGEWENLYKNALLGDRQGWRLVAENDGKGNINVIEEEDYKDIMA